MIVNRGKFQQLKKKKNSYTQDISKMDNKVVKAISSVKPLHFQIDIELNFNLKIANIGISAPTHLNTLTSLMEIKGFEEKKQLING